MVCASGLLNLTLSMCSAQDEQLAVLQKSVRNLLHVSQGESFIPNLYLVTRLRCE